MAHENLRRIVAIDAGAAWSRGMLLSLPATSGAALESAGRGGPGNPNHIGESAAVANVSSLLLSLLASARCSGTQVDAVAVSSTLAATGQEAAALCPNAAAVCIPDTLAAFRSGSSSTSGVVITAGTGSMLSRVEHGAEVRTAGGWGWVLGDEGGAVSLGRACARAVLHALEGGPATSLSAPLLEKVGGAGADAIYAHVYRRGLPPLAMAELAPLITAAAADGDAVAIRILDSEAARLSEQAASLLAAGEPLVLAGGVAPHLSGRVAERLGLSPEVVRDGVVGAALLAADAVGVPADRSELSALWAPHSATRAP